MAQYHILSVSIVIWKKFHTFLSLESTNLAATREPTSSA